MDAGIKPTIAIDVDDVISATASSFIEFSNERYGTNLTIDDYQEHWKEMWKIDLEETGRRAKEFHESGYVAQYEVVSGAREVLEELKKRFRLVVLTNRHGELQKLTHDWLDSYYRGIFDDVVFTGFYDQLTDGSWKQHKGGLAQTLGARYLIDDQPKHIIGAVEHGIEGLLFGEYVWNRHTLLPAGATRVRDWEAVLRYFDNKSTA